MSPDGVHWKVRRRWLERPMPNLRRRLQANRREALDGDALGGIFDPGVLDDGWAVLGVAVLAIVLVLVVLPLLGIALELIALLVVLFSGLFGRVVLRRPWIVEASVAGDPEHRVAFAAQGWRQSEQALDELRTAIAATGPPERLSVGQPLATRPHVSRPS
jgi:hypothetical protein